MPGLYKGVGDGFRSIHAAEGMKGFSLVSTLTTLITNIVFFAGMASYLRRILRTRFRKVRFLRNLQGGLQKRRGRQRAQVQNSRFCHLSRLR